MSIDIKKSKKPVKYIEAIEFLEKRVIDVSLKKKNELIWILEHPSTFTAGNRFIESEILDKKIKLIKTSRGGKITWHGKGQLICYFVIDLSKRKKDIRRFVNLIENVIIESLKKYNIYSFSDRKNIGIWTKDNNRIKKIGAIGIKIKNWVAFHGFSLNINNSLNGYKKIIPCGIKDRDITNLQLIKNQNYKKIKDEIIRNFIKSLEA
ncbi:MAG TPA: lipoyl(octanoyl) transferase LipB [Candidatus Pelagibacter bacterium]|jgi:lipoyl(octanoyl) transferase|nr:lipoyl(octanoyl) transferase LipB [Candidatus Pelagibacter bacterium]|tara:strand:+ start:21552 stop:22172 length:621 start_codon:yes stop_codon:yes gene_type:complete